MTTRKRNLLIGAAVAVALLAIVLVVVLGDGSSNSQAGSTSSTVDSATSSTVSATSTPATSRTSSTTAHGPQNGIPTTTSPATPIPLQITASSGENMHDGQLMTVTVTADDGSAFYGMDARLCTGTAAIENFYDYTPDPAGNCILHPLSHSSDAYLEVPVGPPYHTGTLHFRVGVGTGTFTTENLQHVSITCGPGHPCQLVVRLQYPHGFGFKAFRVTYAG